MKTLFRSFSVAALLALALLPQQASAAAQVLCAPEQAVGTNIRTIGGASSAVPSGTLYTLNGQGCALIAQGDIAYFLSQGFSVGAPGGSFIFTTGVATSTTDFVIGSIPAGAAIKAIYYSNSVAAAVTGGISIGTTANGVDVVAAQACAASCLTFTADASLLKRPFSLTAATPLHAAAVTAWNSANVTITVTWEYF